MYCLLGIGQLDLRTYYVAPSGCNNPQYTRARERTVQAWRRRLSEARSANASETGNRLDRARLMGRGPPNVTGLSTGNGRRNWRHSQARDRDSAPPGLPQPLPRARPRPRFQGQARRRRPQPQPRSHAQAHPFPIHPRRRRSRTDSRVLGRARMCRIVVTVQVVSTLLSPAHRPRMAARHIPPPPYLVALARRCRWEIPHIPHECPRAALWDQRQPFAIAPCVAISERHTRAAFCERWDQQSARERDGCADRCIFMITHLHKNLKCGYV